MLTVAILLVSLLSAVAFAPSSRNAVKSSLRMIVTDLPGVAVKQEGGFFDPWKLSVGKDEKTINWYRAAELKVIILFLN